MTEKNAKEKNDWKARFKTSLEVIYFCVIQTRLPLESEILGFIPRSKGFR